jgi:hypothetical protein
MNVTSNFDNCNHQETRLLSKGARVMSLILHIGYGVLCLVDILLSFGIYHSLLDPYATLIGGYEVGEIELYLWYWLFQCLDALIVVGLILNLWGMPRKQEHGHARTRWIAWTVASPILATALWLDCFITFATLFGDSWMT